MKIQIATDYAIRILQHLHKNEGALQTAMTIATATGVTYPFFIKIANQLKKHKLLNSVQGRNGGYALGMPAREISIYQVLLSIQGELNLRDNELEDCAFYFVLDQLRDNMVAELSRVSIADLTEADSKGGADADKT